MALRGNNVGINVGKASSWVLRNREGGKACTGYYLARGRNQWHAAVNVSLCLLVPKLAEVLTDHSDIL